MSFYSLAFTIFFCVLFALWWLVPQRTRTILLTCANLVFALSLGSAGFFALLLISALGWLFGLLVSRMSSEPGRRAVFWLGIIGMLTPLALYKYLPLLAGHFAWASPFSQLLAPLGVSFYTFKSLACHIEVYRQNSTAIQNPVEYFAYTGYFPQLPMGPIQRPQPFFESLKKLPRHLNTALAFNGCTRILWGMFLKKCLADPLSGHLDALVNPSRYYSLAMLWSLISYCLYLYFDFASYSHLAIGLGELLGLPCAENFKSPYFARSLGDFWHRWHISLSSFLRDYVYIPLGGSRNGVLVLILATMATFLLSGVWHGATGGFILWGALHGVWLLIGRATKKSRDTFWSHTGRFMSGPVRSVIGWGFTMVLVSVGWFFFYAATLPHAIELLAQFQLPAILTVQYIKESIVQIGLTPSVLLQLIVFMLPAAAVDWLSRNKGFGVWSVELRPWVRVLVCYFCLFSVIFFGAAGSLPGIYFAF